VEPENDRSNNLFSDDWREGILGQIPYLNTAIPFGILELSRERESKGMLVRAVYFVLFWGLNIGRFLTEKKLEKQREAPPSL